MKRLKASELPRVRRELLQEQRGICPMCGKDLMAMKPINVCVDHDHDSGKVRAALCRNCNGVLGKIENLATRALGKGERLLFLERAVEFIEGGGTTSLDYTHPTHRTPEEKRAKRNAKSRERYRRKKEQDAE